MTTQITLPKDAEGREIPLDTKVLYSLSGEEYEVDEFTYSPSENIWGVAFAKQFVHFYTCDMQLAPVVVLSADGKPVSIGDTVYCDDDPEPLTVNSLTVSECGPVGVQSAAGANYTVPAVRLTHERPGWEKLLEDLDNAAKGGDNAECLYSRREGVAAGSRCYGCKLYNQDYGSPECEYLAYADIAARIRKLAEKEG
jgi:hypothetical protein